MLTRYFSLIIIVLMFSGCAHLHQKPHQPISPKVAKGNVQMRQMPSFNQVTVKGTIDVRLRTGYKQSSVILRGNPIALNSVVTEVKNKTLFVTTKKATGPVSVEIRSNFLNAFSYKGTGQVTGKNVHSSLLDLDINNSGDTELGGSMVLRKLEVSGGGNVQLHGVYSRSLLLNLNGKSKVLLHGVMNLSKLDLKGEGWLNMYWVKSPYLTICARGNTNIQLAGVVAKLDVELWGTSRFNGHYLRAINAFVKTHDRSIAGISAIKHQHAFASDASDIYFYRIPQTKTDFMAFQGSVLDMRNWNRPDLKDYDRFNKETH